MKIQPIAAPSTPNPAQPSGDARAKAIAAFMQAPAQPVQNQNQITPEEMTGNTSVPIKAEEQSGQEDSTEVVETKTETPEEQALSRQFAQLARQEKILRHKAQQQETAFKAREDAIKAKEAQYQSPDYSNYIAKDLFKKDPLGAMAQAGVNYDELTQQVLSTPLDPRIQQYIESLETRVKAHEEKFSTLEKSSQERETQAYQSALKQIETDVKHLVSNDPTYEMIKATNSYKDVVQLIEETYKKDGQLLTNEEAAEQVENYLIEEALKLSNTSKIKQRLAQSVAPKTPPEQTQGQQKQPQMKTLTNTASSSRQLSAKERAILAFNGQLKT